MIDTTGLGIAVIFIFIIVAGLILALKLLSPGKDRSPAGGQEEAATASIPADEGRFLHGFLRPIYEDGLDDLETGVDVIRESLEFYGRGAFVDAGEGFIGAGRSIDSAARRFREVLNMVEDPGIEDATRAKARLVECRQLRVLARDMEGACDAMIAGNQAEADALVGKAKAAMPLVEGWKKG
jgi:hypothetical protein